MKNFVKKGTIQMDSGERLKIVSPSRMQRLAITSTMENIANYDAGTNQLIAQVNELRQRIETRVKNRTLMEEEFQQAWAEVVVEHELPADLDPRKLKWLEGGRFEVELPPADPGGEDPEADDEGEGDGDVLDDGNSDAAQKTGPDDAE